MRRLIAYLMLRRKLFFLGAIGAGFLGILPIMLLGGHGLVEVVDSSTFCTATCHNVHYAEAITYKSSPHSEVTCSSCHVGAGTQNLVWSKLRGLTDIIPTITGNYERPIPTPLQDRRPSSETCEKCHWSEKFFGDVPLIKTSYAADQSNTKSTTTLVLKVDGGKQEVANGIHWHSTAKVWYLPLDEKREKIGWVVAESPSGNIIEYIDPNLAAEITPARIQSEKRLMDCVDCHNRVTHLFRPPDELVDKALTDGSIDAGLPFIKREAINALVPQNSSLNQAYDKIAQIKDFYQTFYPAIFQEKAASVDKAIGKLREIAELTTFPDGLDWNTHPDNALHNKPDATMNIDWQALSLSNEAQGCFRCHGTLLKVDEKGNAALGQVLNGLDLSTTLKALPDIATSSSISSLKTAGFGAGGLRGTSFIASTNVTAPGVGSATVNGLNEAGLNGGGPGPGWLNADCNSCHSTRNSPLTTPVAPATPHPIDGLDNCLACHSPSGARPFKSDHPWSTNDTCTACHESASTLKPLPLGTPSADAKLIPHAVSNLDNCLVCHGPTSSRPIKPDHPWSTNDTCSSCHKLAQQFIPLPSAAPPPHANQIPHPTAGLGDCLACHGPSGPIPFSSTHAWSTSATCTACHQVSPAVESLTTSKLPAAPGVNHSIAGLGSCVACHNPSGPGPFPPDHNGRPDGLCLICHQAGTQMVAPLRQHSPLFPWLRPYRTQLPGSEPAPHATILRGRHPSRPPMSDGQTAPAPPATSQRQRHHRLRRRFHQRRPYCIQLRALPPVPCAITRQDQRHFPAPTPGGRIAFVSSAINQPRQTPPRPPSPT